jgi:large subunit ribosomal protein L23
MDLSKYDIIKNIIVTTKSASLNEKFSKLTFHVHRDANKIMIKDAIEKIWNVKVDKVHTVTIKGKQKAFGRRSFVSSDKKKAIVTLRDGHKINLPGQFETMGVESKETAKGK